MSNNDSVAQRRELRRKKILENAELRKQKIFGVTSNHNDDNTETSVINDPNPTEKPNRLMKLQNDIDNESNIDISDDKDETCSTKSLESEISSKSQNHEDCSSASVSDVNRVNEILRNIPDPMLEFSTDSIPYEKPKNISKDSFCSFLEVDDSFGNSSQNFSSEYIGSSSSNLHSRNGSGLLSNSSDRSFINFTPCRLLILLEHPASPCFLAILVSLLLYLNLGNLVSHSLIIPFCIWEIQQVIACCSKLEVNEESTSFMDAMLLLCGVRNNIISKYIWILRLIKDVFDDFALYFVTIVLWHLVIGFPSLNTAT